MLHPLRSVLRAFVPTFLFFLLPSLAVAQESAEDESSLMVQFDRDVWPILQAKCLECHGPEDAKNDYRVDDEESLLSYVEAGDLESSSLWVDYLVTEDEDLHMPPVSKPQLSAPELATLRVWIEDGAIWRAPPAASPAEDSSAQDEPITTETIPDSTAGKFWILGGLFHPAMIHFPIALLAVSSGFAFLSFFKKEAFEPVAFHCLWIGTLGAIVACVTGWSYATHEGYSAAAFGIDKAIDRHRWLGICVAIGSVILFFVARAAKNSDSARPRIFWVLGSLVIMAAVSTTGYQGGELTYGEDHYMKEYERLFPESKATVKPDSQSNPDTENAGDDSPVEPSTASAEEPAGISPEVEDPS